MDIITGNVDSLITGTQDVYNISTSQYDQFVAAIQSEMLPFRIAIIFLLSLTVLFFICGIIRLVLFFVCKSKIKIVDDEIFEKRLLYKKKKIIKGVSKYDLQVSQNDIDVTLQKQYYLKCRCRANFKHFIICLILSIFLGIGFHYAQMRFVLYIESYAANYAIQNFDMNDDATFDGEQIDMRDECLGCN